MKLLLALFYFLVLVVPDFLVKMAPQEIFLEIEFWSGSALGRRVTATHPRPPHLLLFLLPFESWAHSLSCGLSLSRHTSLCVPVVS